MLAHEPSPPDSALQHLRLTAAFVATVKPTRSAKTYGDGRGGYGLTLSVRPLPARKASTGTDAPSGPGEGLTVPVVSKTTVRLYPPDVAIIDAWAADNPDPDTGLTPSRPTAIRRMIRAGCTATAAHGAHAEIDPPASRNDLREAVASILSRLDSSERDS